MSPAAAHVIDDFTVGAFVVEGPGSLDQTGLDVDHVIGGTRRITVGQFGTGSRLEVTDADRLKLSSSGAGYFEIKYGAITPLGGIDLTEGGHDRLLIRFGDVGPGFHPFGVYVSLPSNSSSNGESMYVRDTWDGVLVEIPYAAFPTSFNNVQNVTLDAFRNPPGSWFEIESIYTSGPAVAGDYNRDGIVDGADLDEWSLAAGNNGTSSSSARFTPDGDGDGDVDGADWLTWQQNLGPVAAAEAITTPEPSGAIIALPLVLLWANIARASGSRR